MPSKTEGNNEEPMNFSKEHIALFRSYRSAEMSPTERESFETRIAKDQDFRRSFEEFEAFENAIRDAETLDIYDRVGSWEEKHQNKKNTGKVRYLWLGAASVAAALVIIFFIWQPEESQSNDQEIVASYFQPYDNVITVRGKKEVLDKALLAYDQKNYNEALKLFNHYPDDSIAVFYRAETLMALKRYKASIAQFDRVIAQQGIFGEVAQYHKALALLGVGEKEAAITALKDIPKDSYYRKEARQILKSL